MPSTLMLTLADRDLDALRDAQVISAEVSDGPDAPLVDDPIASRWIERARVQVGDRTVQVDCTDLDRLAAALRWLADELSTARQDALDRYAFASRVTCAGCGCLVEPGDECCPGAA